MTVFFKTIISTIILGIINTLGFSMVQLYPIPSPTGFKALVPTENIIGSNMKLIFNLAPASDGPPVYAQDKIRVEQYESQHKQIYADLKAELINFDLQGNGNMAPDIKSKSFKIFNDCLILQSISIGIINMDFEYLDEKSISDNLLDIQEQDSLLVDVPNRSRSPYIKTRALVMSTLATDTKSKI